MNKFQIIYYKTLSTLLPNFFLPLVLWTCYDIFLTSLVTSMMYYLLITLYYFKINSYNLNTLIKTKVEELVFSKEKSKNFGIGYFFGSIFSIIIMNLLMTSKEGVFLMPLPKNTPNSSIFIYFLFIIFLFGFCLQIISELFYKVFVKSVFHLYLGVFLETLIEVEVVFFFTQDITLLFCFCFFFLGKNFFLSKMDFEKSVMFKVGFGNAFVAFLAVLIVVSKKFDLLSYHPNNYWKF